MGKLYLDLTVKKSLLLPYLFNFVTKIGTFLEKSKYLCDFFEVVRGDGDHGGAEDVEVDDEVGGAALADDVAFESGEVTTDDSDVVTEVEGLCREVDGAVGMVEHELEAFHLGVGDDSEGMPAEVVGVTCLVGQEVIDIGEVDDVPTFTFGDMDEEEVGEEHPFHLLLLTGAPDAGLILGCHIGFIAEGGESFTTRFLGISAHHGDEPLAVRHAYGVVNFLSWRNVRIHGRIDIHKICLSTENAFPLKEMNE